MLVSLVFSLMTVMLDLIVLLLVVSFGTIPLLLYSSCFIFRAFSKSSRSLVGLLIASFAASTPFVISSLVSLISWASVSYYGGAVSAEVPTPISCFSSGSVTLNAFERFYGIFLGFFNIEGGIFISIFAACLAFII